MDRLIEVRISGNLLVKDGNRAGVQGEGNVTTLRLTFDEGWDGLAKHLTWWDAYGENPVKVILGADKLEDMAEDTRVYRCLIPPEPLKEAGWCSFVIDGYIDDKRQRTVEDKLKVLPAASAEDAADPSDPTPSQAEQLQGEIENLLGGMQDAARVAKEAVAKAGEVFDAADRAEEARNAVENMTVTAQHVPPDSTHPALERGYNEDGTMSLHFFLKQALSGVFVGSGEMPEGYNVQVNPDGEGCDVAAVINEALQEAKDSGTFDGERGRGILKVETAPGFWSESSGYEMNEWYQHDLATVLRESGAREVLVGDQVLVGHELYTVEKVDRYNVRYSMEVQNIRGPAGKDGKDGRDGIDGKNGQDGYTPQKGIDYFDGKDGANGKDGSDGYTPIKGVDYFDGVDGKDGANGKDGVDGKTPIKGTDYFTVADKQELVAAVLAALPAAEEASF